MRRYRVIYLTGPLAGQQGLLASPYYWKMGRRYHDGVIIRVLEMTE